MASISSNKPSNGEYSTVFALLAWASTVLIVAGTFILAEANRITPLELGLILGFIIVISGLWKSILNGIATVFSIGVYLIIYLFLTVTLVLLDIIGPLLRGVLRIVLPIAAAGIAAKYMLGSEWLSKLGINLGPTGPILEAIRSFFNFQ